MMLLFMMLLFMMLFRRLFMMLFRRLFMMLFRWRWSVITWRWSGCLARRLVKKHIVQLFAKHCKLLSFHWND
jgi:hypothetical protein